MAKLSKILNYVLAVLGLLLVAGTVFSYLYFLKYEDRARRLSEGLQKTSATLEQDLSNNKFKKVTYSPKQEKSKEDGTISWPAYRSEKDKTHKEFQETVSSVEERAKKVIEQRNREAETIATSCLKLGLGKELIPVDDLKDLCSYDKYLTLSIGYAEAMHARDVAFVANLKSYGRLLGGLNMSALDRLPRRNGDGSSAYTVADDKAYLKPLKDMENRIKDLNARREAFRRALINAPGQMRQHGTWQFRGGNLNGAAYNQELAKLARDFAEINKKLAELAKVKRDLQNVRNQLAAAQKRERDLQQKLRNAQAQINKLQNEKAQLTKKPVGKAAAPVRVKMTDLANLNYDITAPLLYRNPAWNFVVVGFDETQVMAGVKVVIQVNGSYLTSGVVSKVLEDKGLSIVELDNPDCKIPENAMVIISDLNKKK